MSFHFHNIATKIHENLKHWLSLKWHAKSVLKFLGSTDNSKIIVKCILTFSLTLIVISSWFPENVSSVSLCAL